MNFQLADGYGYGQLLAVLGRVWVGYDMSERGGLYLAVLLQSGWL